MQMSIREMYDTFFTEYPDVLNAQQVCAILDISTKTLYRLINKGVVEAVRIGRPYRIPKFSIIQDLGLVDERPKS